MFILGTLVGFFIGYFVASIFFQFIIDDVIYKYTMGEEYEKRKDKK